MTPLARRRWETFKRNKRGYYALWIFLILFIVSMFAPFLANDKPILLWYKNHLFFPMYETVNDNELDGNLPTPADFKDAFTKWQIQKYGWALSTPIPYSFDTVDYFSTEPFPTAPSVVHWLGTDDQGRDVLARLIYAVRVSLLFGILLTIASVVIGVFVGAVQGYFGGKTDLLTGRFLEVWSSLPQLFILIIISSLIEPGFFSLLIVLLFFSWTSLTGVVRAEFLKAREMDYVRAAKGLGVSDWVIIRRHILPNALVATITYVPFMISGAIVALSALDFLGFGLPAGSASLGELIRVGKENLQAPWLGFSVFVVLTVLLSLLLFIGEGVRDAFDPNGRENTR